jgi:BirA family biotin operon repressor/biotin-[acetyl-CoA-carboxylase] ligase
MEFSTEKIRGFLPDHHPWANSIICFDTIASTNTHAKKLAAEGAPHGTVLIADQQTGGRGRMGRQFYSPVGSGIYMSVIIRPDHLPGELMHLTCAAGAAMCRAVESVAGVCPGLKWINDLVWEGKKLGGILAEMALAPATGKCAYAVVGIGINCSQNHGDFPAEIAQIATSLKQITGKSINRSHLAAAMIHQLHAMSENLVRDKETIMDFYRRHCVTLGKEVSVHRFDEVRHGTALDIDADGGLTGRFNHGTVQTVSAGEVSIRGMYGYV